MESISGINAGIVSGTSQEPGMRRRTSTSQSPRDHTTTTTTERHPTADGGYRKTTETATRYHKGGILDIFIDFLS